MKGLVLSNSDLIRNVHNSFNKPEPFVFTKEKRSAKESDDLFHFISYVPFKNKVYELDGL
jgi:ubiquitin carboxyl-terminal hydrolase L5